MNINSSRQPAGVPSGGQFAASSHDEADVVLAGASPAVNPTREAIDAHLDAAGYGSLDDWAAESDYRSMSGIHEDRWYDEDDNEVDIEVAYLNAMEAAQAALEQARQDYDEVKGSGSWAQDSALGAAELSRLHEMFSQINGS